MTSKAAKDAQSKKRALLYAQFFAGKRPEAAVLYAELGVNSAEKESTATSLSLIPVSYSNPECMVIQSCPWRHCASPGAKRSNDSG
jgi:hypothetical protein